MIENFSNSLNLVLESEGGYVDNPKDPGGVTNLGVTARTWATYKGRATTKKEMMALTPETVAPLYKKKYWDACNCDALPSGIDYLLFDFAVNAGTGRSIKTMQSVLGLPQDGQVGPVMIQNIEVSDKNDLIVRFSEAKKVFYESLSTFPEFGKGWLHRIDVARMNASKMLG